MYFFIFLYDTTILCLLLLYVVHRMNEGYKAWGALKSVQSNSGLGIKAEKCLYEGIIVPTALYGAQAWGVLREGK